MGLPAARLGDIGSGHACHFPPSPAIEGSPNVIINGRPAVRKGDAYAAHGCSTCPSPPHGRKLAAGSPTVFLMVVKLDGLVIRLIVAVLMLRAVPMFLLAHQALLEHASLSVKNAPMLMRLNRAVNEWLLSKG